MVQKQLKKLEEKLRMYYQKAAVTDREYKNTCTESRLLKATIVGMLAIILDESEFDRIVSNGFSGNFRNNYLSYYENEDEFVKNFIEFVNGGKLIEPSTKNAYSFDERPLVRLTKSEMDNIRNNYSSLEYNSDEFNKNVINLSKYHWEIAISDTAQDIKYGRIVIDRNLKITRKITMGEFYQSSPVD